MKKQKQNETTALVKWDEELAKQAAIAAGMEDSTATGQFFSLKGGVLSWNDAPLPNNQMAVIIVGSILENVYYEGKFDPEVPQSPVCFAFGRDEKELKPHEVVVKAKTAQCDNCHDCRWNEWGTSDVGRGKACRNTRRLAMIAAGGFDSIGKYQPFDDPKSAVEQGALGFMKLPVTSVKGFAAFVKQLAGVLKRPPHGVVTKVRVVPDPKSQFKVTFEPIVNVPNELLGAVMKRHEEAMSLIAFPYAPMEEEEAGRGQGRGGKKGAAHAAAPQARGRKKY